MKITWTSSAPALGATTLVDDSVKITGVIESLGGESVCQTEPLYGAATVANFARGNVRGQFSFTARKSHATRDLAMLYLAGEYGRLNQAGTIIITQDSTTLTFAKAVLRGVNLVKPNGLEFTLRYTFEITTITTI